MTLQNAFIRASVIAYLESGPLGAYLADLATALSNQHYAAHTKMNDQIETSASPGHRAVGQAMRVRRARK